MFIFPSSGAKLLLFTPNKKGYLALEQGFFLFLNKIRNFEEVHLK